VSECITLFPVFPSVLILSSSNVIEIITLFYFVRMIVQNLHLSTIHIYIYIYNKALINDIAVIKCVIYDTKLCATLDVSACTTLILIVTWV